MDDDLYRVLQVEPDATQAQLKKAYRALARELHPDRNPSPDAERQFREVASAWETLGDPARRAEYDLARGRVSRGELPDDFLDAMGTAMERAERWVREGVLPSYARYHRGAGLELAVRLLADLDDLRTPSDLPPAGWLQRRRVARTTDRIDVTALLTPARDFSRLNRYGRRFEVIVQPYAFWHGGVRDPVLLDDVVIQVLITRFALVLGAWRGPQQDPDGTWTTALEWARQTDDRMLQEARRRWAWRGVLVALLGFLFTAGYMGW
jgi:hypothetical protein